MSEKSHFQNTLRLFWMEMDAGPRKEDGREPMDIRLALPM